jgi:hypothetical protein
MNFYMFQLVIHLLDHVPRNGGGYLKRLHDLRLHALQKPESGRVTHAHRLAAEMQSKVMEPFEVTSTVHLLDHVPRNGGGYLKRLHDLRLHLSG